MKKDLDIRLVLDSYGTRKTPEVNAWLAKHLHFTPTSGLLAQSVERYFADSSGPRPPYSFSTKQRRALDTPKAIEAGNQPLDSDQ